MRSGDRWLMRVLLMFGLAAALGLAGCGRKADLDPPSASITPPPAEPGAQPAAGTAPAQGSQPVTPSRDKRIILDWLLN